MKRFIYELTESWKIALAQMQANKTRSMLMALGVIIGIVAVTLMGTAIAGIQTAIGNCGNWAIGVSVQILTAASSSDSSLAPRKTPIAWALSL